MNPAPNAMKYFKYRCTDRARVISEAPTTFAPAAVSPSKSARSIGCAPEENMRLTRVAEQDHIAVLHDVFLTFQAHLRPFTRDGKSAGLQEVFPVHNFGLDEAALDVTVNRARGFLRVHSALDGPRTALRLAAS